MYAKTFLIRRVGQSHFTYTESTGTGKESIVIKKNSRILCFVSWKAFESGKRESKICLQFYYKILYFLTF
jgi:hypothetical protein